MVSLSTSSRRVSNKQDRSASRQDLRGSEGLLADAHSQDRLGRASTVGNSQETLRELADEDAAVLTPTRANEADVSKWDHRAAFHGDLVHSSKGEESHPLPVR